MSKGAPCLVFKSQVPKSSAGKLKAEGSGVREAADGGPGRGGRISW